MYKKVFLLLTIFLGSCNKDLKESKRLEKLDLQDGQIIKTQAFIPHDYDSFDMQTKRMLSREEYRELEQWFNNSPYEFQKINYMSDGLSIVGILGKPKAIERNKKYPAVIFNRGGTGEYGKINLFTLKERFEYLLNAGYIVLGSQYRGNDESEGKDEWGGSDINDVLNLVKASKTLPYIDINNVFMFGHSRGGMMTYLALKKNVEVRAAAVIAGPTDLFDAKEYRTDIFRIYSHYIPNIKSNEKQELQTRSALYWADKINIPLLIIHGDKDKNVNVQEAKKLAHELERYNKEFKLLVFPDGSHGLYEYEQEVNSAILNWFENHK